MRKKSYRATWWQHKHKTEQRRVKNPPINYELWQLHNISQDGMLFLNLILKNRWLDCVYTDDLEHNKKLQFIHAWYNARGQNSKPVEDKPPEDTQTTLFD